MSEYEITFRVDVPEDVTSKDVEHWIKFNIGVMGGISDDNPLCDEDLEAKYHSVSIRKI